MTNLAICHGDWSKEGQQGGVTTTYKYDGFDRRISKTVGTTAMYFVYDGDEIIEERSSTGTTNATYVYGDGLDEVLVMARAGSNKYYFQDSLGSVASVTNAAGTMLERYEYSPYGKATIFNASNATIAASAIGNPILFTGRWLDSESGLYDYRARAYSLTTGRFLQRDPLGYADSMNLYSYVTNSPNNYIDPYGLEALWPLKLPGPMNGLPGLPLDDLPINIPPFNLSQNGNGGFLPGEIGPTSPCHNGPGGNPNVLFSKAGGGESGKGKGRGKHRIDDSKNPKIHNDKTKKPEADYANDAPPSKPHKDEKTGKREPYHWHYREYNWSEKHGLWMPGPWQYGGPGTHP